MSGALSPATQPRQDPTAESPFEKKATFVTESDTTIDDEESEEDDLDKLDVIMKGERKEQIEEAHNILIEKRLRKWLVKHGKAELLDF
jgi:centrin-1